MTNIAMDGLSGPEDCNCLAARQAARHITQFYDQFLAPSGLRTTQFSILATLSRLGPMTINALAADLVMDRTTLGRNLLPLERDGLVAIEQGSRDHRQKVVRLTEAGAARFRAGVKGWTQAQKQFAAAFGAKRTVELRALLHAVAETELEFPCYSRYSGIASAVRPTNSLLRRSGIFT
jgi:DNA-binding MarR family transcriptional regulator